MATTIAISGKGGSGKTTLAAMIIRLLCGQPAAGKPALLAVDADPNCCLGLTLGAEPAGTIAEIREKVIEKPPTNTGMDRVRLFEYQIQQAITESDRFDLLTMGQPEGPGCYCAANNLLRKFLDELKSAYGFMVIDNEAGMEHLSRRTTNNVDLLCIVAEPTSLGAITAQRIFNLAKQLPIPVKELGIIWNRNRDSSLAARGPSDKRQATSDEIETFGCMPYDKAVFDASIQGKTIFELEENSPALLAVRKIIDQKLMINS